MPRSVCELDEVSLMQNSTHFGFLWLTVTSCIASLIMFFSKADQLNELRMNLSLAPVLWLSSQCWYWHEFCGWKTQVSIGAPGLGCGVGMDKMEVISIEIWRRKRAPSLLPCSHLREATGTPVPPGSMFGSLVMNMKTCPVLRVLETILCII